MDIKFILMYIDVKNGTAHIMKSKSSSHSAAKRFHRPPVHSIQLKTYFIIIPRAKSRIIRAENRQHKLKVSDN